VVPGKYELVLKYNGQEISQELEVKADPRWTATASDYQVQHETLLSLRAAILDTRQMAGNLRSLRTQIKDLQDRVDKEKFADWHKQAAGVVKSVDAAEAELIQTKQKTFQDVINFPNKLDADLLHIYGAINDGEPPVTEGQKLRAKDLLAKYNTVKNQVNHAMEGVNGLEKSLVDQKIPFLVPKKKT
jgi:hypothetical protein